VICFALKIYPFDFEMYRLVSGPPFSAGFACAADQIRLFPLGYCTTAPAFFGDDRD